MLLSFIVWALAVWGMAFLAADARIFGCDTSSFLDPGTKPLPKGIFPIRQRLLSASSFLREFLHCYFCMGFWFGPAALLLLNACPLEEFWLPFTGDFQTKLCAILASSFIGAPSSYFLNLLAEKLEAQY